MFYIVDMAKVIRIPAASFGNNIKDSVKKILGNEAEGKIDEKHGVIICIVDVLNMGEAKVPLGDSAAYIAVNYKTLVFTPEIGAVYEAQIKDLVEFGVFLGLGPFDGLVHVSQLMDDFINYDAKNRGFIGRDTKLSLSLDDIVFAKLINCSSSSDVVQTKIGLTMRQKGLGKMDWILKSKKDGEEGSEDKEKKPKKASATAETEKPAKVSKGKKK